MGLISGTRRSGAFPDAQSDRLTTRVDRRVRFPRKVPVDVRATARSEKSTAFGQQATTLAHDADTGAGI